MASDNYLTASDYAAQLGDDVYAAVLDAVGSDGLETLSQQATSFVQGFMQNSGYITPTLDELVADDTKSLGLIKLAVGAALRELISAIPDVNLPLPESTRWDQHIGKRALEGILSGDMELVGLTQSTETAPGGVVMTTTSSSSDRENNRQRSSRRQLRGY